MSIRINFSVTSHKDKRTKSLLVIDEKDESKTAKITLDRDKAALLASMLIRPVKYHNNQIQLSSQEMEYIIPISKTEKLIIPGSEIESYLKNKAE